MFLMDWIIRLQIECYEVIQVSWVLLHVALPRIYDISVSLSVWNIPLTGSTPMALPHPAASGVRSCIMQIPPKHAKMQPIPGYCQPVLAGQGGEDACPYVF